MTGHPRVKNVTDSSYVGVNKIQTAKEFSPTCSVVMYIQILFISFCLLMQRIYCDHK